jgi:hypothetical protein
MGKARRKPSDLKEFQTTDTGPDTAAQKFGVVYHRPKDGRPGERRKTRQHPLERMASHGAITEQQKDAGIAALNLYERALPGGGGLSEYVEKSMDCGQIAALTAEAKMRYAKAVRSVSPGPMTQVFSHVVLDCKYLIEMRGCRTSHAARQRMTRLLRVALDRLHV